MPFRNYRIVIEPRNGFIIPEHIPTIFGCTVSEPSALAASPRKLAFTNENRVFLNNHPVLTHQHTFIKQLPGNPPELSEVDHLVWALLNEAGITTSQVNVRVSYID